MNRLLAQRVGKVLRLSFKGDYTGDVEIRLESFRNRTITRMSDVSSCMPVHLRRVDTRAQEVWYPVIDIEVDTRMEAVATFEHWEGERYVFNGMFHKEGHPLSPRLVFPASLLEYWENAIETLSSKPRLTDFYLRTAAIAAEGGFELELELLTELWGGVVSVYAADGELLSSVIVPIGKVDGCAQAEDTDALSRGGLLSALDSTIAYLLRARNTKTDSMTAGGVNLFYDFDAKLFRTSHWVWTWGIVIKALLGAAREGVGAHPPELLRQAAVEMGECSLRFQLEQPEHPADGAVLVRQDIWPEQDFHYHGCYSHADSMFLAGWGWMPLYELTGDERYLKATRRLAEAIEKTNGMFPIIPQDYYETEQMWAPHGINESGFGAKGFAEAFLATKDGYYKQVAEDYFQQHLDIYQLDNGLWNRYYRFAEQKVEPCNYWTRGMGWGMMGLLAMNDIDPGGVYLGHAKKMAEHLMRHQHPDGCWAHQFTGSIEETGACEKSTSLWCMLFYMLHKVTGDECHLQAARKALRWCISRQYFGNDPDAAGALIGYSANSGIVYRNWFQMACTYSSAFFAVALLEEQKLG